MIKNFIRRRIRTIKRYIIRKKLVVSIVSIVLLGVVLGYTGGIPHERPAIDPASYQSLLSVIAKAESNGNYNAYFSNAGNTSIDFTTMSIADVMKWQAEYVANGGASSAVGRYQIIDSTLAGLVRELHIDTRQKFDPQTQDAFAIALIERRGAYDYIRQELSPESFAANLAKEWAGLPKMIGDNPQQSYYAGDGLNESRVDQMSVLEAVKQITLQK